MSTRSLIAFQTENKFLGITTDYDGYPNGILPILNKDFNNLYLVRDLLSKGCLKSLQTMEKSTLNIRPFMTTIGLIETFKFYYNSECCNYAYIFNADYKPRKWLTFNLDHLKIVGMLK